MDKSHLRSKKIFTFSKKAAWKKTERNEKKHRKFIATMTVNAINFSSHSLAYGNGYNILLADLSSTGVVAVFITF